eukprot:SAG31_NODE_425_length_15822_cov_10.580758_1_plen_502_part_00
MIPVSDGSNIGENYSCGGHQTGPLCASCVTGYEQSGHTSRECYPCEMQNYFGMTDSEIIFVVLAAIAVLLLLLAGLWVDKGKTLGLIWREVRTNVKIMLGLWQVLTLLPETYGLLLPDSPRSFLTVARVMIFDISAVFNPQCHIRDFYTRWLVSTFLPPVLALLAIAIWWIVEYVIVWKYFDDRATREEGDRRQRPIGAAFFVTMLLYPRLSNQIFTLLQCQSLGPGPDVLVIDYSIKCDAARYKTYQHAAYLLVVLIPVGLPAFLLGVLLRAQRRHTNDFNKNEGSQDLAVLPAHMTAAQFSYNRMQSTFDFCIRDFKPELLWFEPVDMVRKVTLTGLLQFCERGTLAQAFCGCSVAVCMLLLQERLSPYKESKSNLLKTMVEIQIFFFFLMLFILRVLANDNDEFDYFEPITREKYGDILVGSMLCLVAVFVLLTALQTCERRRFRQRLSVSANVGFELRNSDYASDDGSTASTASGGGAPWLPQNLDSAPAPHNAGVE